MSGLIRNHSMFVATNGADGTLKRKLTLFYQGSDPCVVTDSLIDGVWPDGVVTWDFGEYSPTPGTPWRAEP